MSGRKAAGRAVRHAAVPFCLFEEWMHRSGYRRWQRDADGSAKLTAAGTRCGVPEGPAANALPRSPRTLSTQWFQGRAMRTIEGRRRRLSIQARANCQINMVQNIRYGPASASAPGRPANTRTGHAGRRHGRIDGSTGCASDSMATGGRSSGVDISYIRTIFLFVK
jgi:hypothetical protein